MDEQNNNIDFSSLEKSEYEYSGEAENGKKKKSGSTPILAGICLELSERFNIETFYIRAAFIFSLFFGIWGIVAYLIAAIMYSNKSIISFDKSKSNNSFVRLTFIILMLFLLLLIFLLTDLLAFIFTTSLLGSSEELLLSFFMIVSGIIIFRKRKVINFSANKLNVPLLYKSMRDKKISGVCGGLADYFNLDSNFVRILWILLAFVTAGFGLIIYLIFIILLPSENLLEAENGQ